MRYTLVRVTLMATTTVTLPADLVCCLVRDYTRANPEYCIGTEGAIEGVLTHALRFALMNKEFWCPDTNHTPEATTPSPSS